MSSELVQLPKMTAKIVDRLTANGLSTLSRLASARNTEIESALTKGESLGQKAVGDVLQAVKDIPLFKIDGLAVQRSTDGVTADESVFRPSEALSKGLNVTVSLTVSRVNGKDRSVVFTPRYHKEKTASWSVLIESRGKVLAYKKLASLEGQQQFKLSVALNSGAAEVRAHVFCDALIGTDKVEKCTASV